MMHVVHVVHDMRMDGIRHTCQAAAALMVFQMVLLGLDALAGERNDLLREVSSYLKRGLP